MDFVRSLLIDSMRCRALRIIRPAGIEDIRKASSTEFVEKLSCVVDKLSAVYQHMIPYVIMATKNYHVTQLMLLYGLDPSKPEPFEKKTALHLAVEKNDDKLVRLLIEYGADLNARDLLDRTPMHYLRSIDAKLAKLMIEKGADSNAWDRDGLFPLHFALMTRGLELVKYLFEHTEVGLFHKTSDGETLLHYAVLNDDPDVAGYLITLGAEIDVRGANFKTPLHVAVGKPNMDSFRLLLECGADPNLEIFDGNTVLQFALNIREPSDTFFSELFRAGAEINVSELGLLLECHSNKYNKEKEIAKHIAILEITGNFVPPLITKSLLRSKWMLLDAFEPFGTFGYVDCKAELERLKEIKFYKDFSMLDILTQSDDKLVNLFKCKYVRRLYKDCRGKMKGFNEPIYFYSINKTVKRVFAKIILIQFTETFLNDILPLYTPCNAIVDRIIAHMTFNDMNVLFRLANLTESNEFSYLSNPHYYRF